MIMAMSDAGITSIDRTRTEKFSSVWRVKTSPELRKIAIAEFMKEVGSYGTSWVVLQNVEEPDGYYDVRSGVASGGYIFIQKEFVAIVYNIAHDAFTVVLDNEVTHLSDKLLRMLSPNNYLSTYGAEMIGSAPLATIALNGVVIQSFMNVDTMNIPLCDKAILNKKQPLAYYGLKTGASGIDFIPSTAKGCFSSLVSIRRGLSMDVETGDTGICFLNKNAITQLNRFKQGLAITINDFCRRYSLPASETISNPFNFGLLERCTLDNYRDFQYLVSVSASAEYDWLCLNFFIGKDVQDCSYYGQTVGSSLDTLMTEFNEQYDKNVKEFIVGWFKEVDACIDQVATHLRDLTSTAIDNISFTLSNDDYYSDNQKDFSDLDTSSLKSIVEFDDGSRAPLSWGRYPFTQPTMRKTDMSKANERDALDEAKAVLAQCSSVIDTSEGLTFSETMLSEVEEDQLDLLNTEISAIVKEVYLKMKNYGASGVSMDSDALWGTHRNRKSHVFTSCSETVHDYTNQINVSGKPNLSAFSRPYCVLEDGMLKYAGVSNVDALAKVFSVKVIGVSSQDGKVKAQVKMCVRSHIVSATTYDCDLMNAVRTNQSVLSKIIQQVTNDRTAYATLRATLRPGDAGKCVLDGSLCKSGSGRDFYDGCSSKSNKRSSAYYSVDWDLAVAPFGIYDLVFNVVTSVNRDLDITLNNQGDVNNRLQTMFIEGQQRANAAAVNWLVAELEKYDLARVGVVGQRNNKEFCDINDILLFSSCVNGESCRAIKEVFERLLALTDNDSDQLVFTTNRNAKQYNQIVAVIQAFENIEANLPCNTPIWYVTSLKAIDSVVAPELLLAYWLLS